MTKANSKKPIAKINKKQIEQKMAQKIKWQIKMWKIKYKIG